MVEDHQGGGQCRTSTRCCCCFSFSFLLFLPAPHCSSSIYARYLYIHLSHSLTHSLSLSSAEPSCTSTCNRPCSRLYLLYYLNIHLCHQGTRPIPITMQFSVLLPISLLASYAAAQTTSACAAQPVLEACLASTQAIASDCASNDYNCLCPKWKTVLQ